MAARELYETITFTIKKFVVEDGAVAFRLEQWSGE
jgi:hypothetical protein